jgi:hypothetical protein
VTEQEWLECADLTPMVKFLFPSERKRRLFTAACFRRIWPLIPDQGSRTAIDAVEQGEGHNLWEKEIEKKADEAVWDSDDMARRLAARAVADFIRFARLPPLRVWSHQAMREITKNHNWYPCRCADAVARAVGLTVAEENREKAMETERRNQTNLFRDVFGNPFRPVTLDPFLLTPTVVQLAQTIYNDRAFEQMSALADALVGTGCDNEEVLSHCRGPEPHVRGCWVVDLILGRG